MRILFGVLLVGLCLTNVSSQSTDRPVQPNLPGEIMVDFGFNFLNKFPDILDTKFFPSRSFGVFYQRTFVLGNRFTFHPGLGITNDRLGWKNDVNFLQDSTRKFVFDTLTVDPKKNILTFSYLEIPAEIRFYPFKSTTSGEGFFIGVGGMVGVKIDAHTKIKYDFEGETRVEKDKSNFGLNDFRFGYVVRLGWKPINLYYKQYASDLFQKGPLGTNPVLLTFGINFTGF